MFPHYTTMHGWAAFRPPSGYSIAHRSTNQTYTQGGLRQNCAGHSVPRTVHEALLRLRMAEGLRKKAEYAARLWKTYG